MEPLLLQLAELIEANNLTALRCFAELKGVLGGERLPEEVQTLETLLYQMQFVEARAALTALSLSLEKLL